MDHWHLFADLLQPFFSPFFFHEYNHFVACHSCLLRQEPAFISSIHMSCDLIDGFFFCNCVDMEWINGKNTSKFCSHVSKMICKGVYSWGTWTPHNDARIWDVKILHETWRIPKDHNQSKVEQAKIKPPPQTNALKSCVATAYWLWEYPPPQHQSHVLVLAHMWVKLRTLIYIYGTKFKKGILWCVGIPSQSLIRFV